MDLSKFLFDEIFLNRVSTFQPLKKSWKHQKLKNPFPDVEKSLTQVHYNVRGFERIYLEKILTIIWKFTECNSGFWLETLFYLRAWLCLNFHLLTWFYSLNFISLEWLRNTTWSLSKRKHLRNILVKKSRQTTGEVWSAECSH